MIIHLKYTIIGELKKMIEIKDPCFKVENQQIIYNGNILTDDLRIGRKNVNEIRNFNVILH